MWQNWFHWTVALLLAVAVGFLLGWTTRPSAVLAEQPGLIAMGRHTIIPSDAIPNTRPGGPTAIVLDTITGESWLLQLSLNENMLSWDAMGPARKPGVSAKQSQN